MTIVVITTIVVDVNGPRNKTKGYGSRQEDVFIAIQRAAEELRATFAELFKTHELTSSQYNVLRILRGAGSDGLSCREISERLIHRDSDVTRMLDRLEARELIMRERQTDDRRVVLTFITEKGSALLADLDKPVDDLHNKQLGHLSESELSGLTDLLEKALRI